MKEVAFEVKIDNEIYNVTAKQYMEAKNKAARLHKRATGDPHPIAYIAAMASAHRKDAKNYWFMDDWNRLGGL